MTLKIDEQKRKRIAEIEKLTDAEKLCLDGFLISDLPPTTKSIVAYRASRDFESKANEQAIYTQARRWLNTDKCRFYIEDKATQLNIDIKGVRNVKANKTDKMAVTNRDEVVNRDKESVVKELNELASLTNDPKLKAEMLMKLADLEGMKKQDNTDEESRISYYMPLKCSKCSIYKSAKMTQANNPKP